MHPAKRRRTDNAASILTKPFRSPLHVDPNRQKSSFEKQDDQGSQVPKCTSPTKPSQISQPTSSSSPITTSAALPTWTGTRRPPSTSLSSPIKKSYSRLTTHDSVYIALQKQHSALTLRLKDLSASLDTATQALKIAQSRKDDDLQCLITKWRTASRDAAEELFCTAKDRVNRMGGVGAWRDKYMTPQEGRSWNDEPEIDEDDLSEEQREQIDIAREEAKAEAEKYGLYEQAQPMAGVKDDDSFTIDMMLKQLNVDLQVIGYDAEGQRWMD